MHGACRWYNALVIFIFILCPQKHIGETFKRPPVFFDLPEMGFKKMKPDGETTANLSALFQDSV